MRLYLAARYGRREELAEYAGLLRRHGHVVTSRWLDGDHQSLDTNLLHPANHDIAGKFLREDLEDLLSADTIVAFTEPPNGPSRGGRHVEFGVALARGLRLFVVGPRENLFYLAPGVRQYNSFDELQTELCPCGAAVNVGSVVGLGLDQS